MRIILCCAFAIALIFEHVSDPAVAQVFATIDNPPAGIRAAERQMAFHRQALSEREMFAKNVVEPLPDAASSLRTKIAAQRTAREELVGAIKAADPDLVDREGHFSEAVTVHLRLLHEASVETAIRSGTVLHELRKRGLLSRGEEIYLLQNPPPIRDWLMQLYRQQDYTVRYAAASAAEKAVESGWLLPSDDVNQFSLTTQEVMREGRNSFYAGAIRLFSRIGWIPRWFFLDVDSLPHILAFELSGPSNLQYWTEVGAAQVKAGLLSRWGLEPYMDQLVFMMGSAPLDGSRSMAHFFGATLTAGLFTREELYQRLFPATASLSRWMGSSSQFERFSGFETLMILFDHGILTREDLQRPEQPLILPDATTMISAADSFGTTRTLTDHLAKLKELGLITSVNLSALRLNSHKAGPHRIAVCAALAAQGFVSVEAARSFLGPVDYGAIVRGLLDGINGHAIRWETPMNAEVAAVDLHWLLASGLVTAEEVRRQLRPEHLANIVHGLGSSSGIDTQALLELIDLLDAYGIVLPRELRTSQTGKWESLFLASVTERESLAGDPGRLSLYSWAMRLAARLWRTPELFERWFDYIGYEWARYYEAATYGMPDAAFFDEIIDAMKSSRGVEAARAVLFEKTFTRTISRIEDVPKPPFVRTAWQHWWLFSLLERLAQDGSPYWTVDHILTLMALAAKIPINLFESLLQRLVMTRPELFSENLLDALSRLLPNKQDGNFLRLLWSQRRPDAAELPSPEKFSPEAAQARAVFNRPNARVLMVLNLRFGMGDELIVNLALLESMLAANPTLRVLLYTDREFIYDHERVDVRPVNSLDHAQLMEEHKQQPFDAVFHEYDVNQNYVQTQAGVVRNFVQEIKPPVVFDMGDQGTSYDRQLATLQVQGQTIPLSTFGSNVYSAQYRIIAELGLPLWPNLKGRRAPGTSVLTGRPDPEYEKVWAPVVADLKAKGKRLVLMNGFGGTFEEKGFSRDDEGQARFAGAVETVLQDPSVTVILLPNHQEWGTPTIAAQVRAKLHPSLQERVMIGPDPRTSPRTQKHLVDHSDLLLTVEGGLMHLAFHLGIPMIPLWMMGSGDFTAWLSLAALPTQRPQGLARSFVESIRDRLWPDVEKESVNEPSRPIEVPSHTASLKATPYFLARQSS